MTTKLSAVAAGFIGAFAIIGAAVAAPVAPAEASDDVTGSIATPVSTADSSIRVYCYNGDARDGTTRHRGWVCQQETGAPNKQ
jgi:hypothetical protein